MALSKNIAIADCLNSVRASNVESAATEAHWMELSDYFGGAVSDDSVSSNESDSSDVSQNESDSNDDDSLAGSVVIDEVAAVMDTVDIVDADSAAEQRNVREFSCVNKSSKNSCDLNNDNPCFSGLTEEFVLELRMNMSSLPDYEKDLIILAKISSTIRNAPMAMTEKSRRKEQTTAHKLLCRRTTGLQRNVQVSALVSTVVLQLCQYLLYIVYHTILTVPAPDLH